MSNQKYRQLRPAYLYRAVIATLVLLLGCISSAWAYRVIEQIEGAYELLLGEVRLPRGETSSVLFKPCETCTITLLRVDSTTTYFVNGEPLKFSDFLGAVEAIRQLDGGNQNTAVYVFFDVQSRRVTRLLIDHFGG